MSFLKSVNRYMERNRAASRALLMQLDAASVTDIGEFSKELYELISESLDGTHELIVIDDGVAPFEFIVRLLVKLGFDCEDAVRLMMKAHKDGFIVLARAKEPALLGLQTYIKKQAAAHGLSLATQVKSRIVTEC